MDNEEKRSDCSETMNSQIDSENDKIPTINYWYKENNNGITHIRIYKNY